MYGEALADDTKLYHEIKTVEDQHSLQSNIDNIITWTYTWLMKLNLEKCKHMEIGNITNNSAYSLDQGSTTILKVTNEKDLVITFD